MRPNKKVIEALLAEGGGVIARRANPEIASALAWLTRRGDLCPVLPGVYAARTAAADPNIRMRAAMAWEPDAVLTGACAARLSFWPAIPLRVVTVALRRQSAVKATGFHLEYRPVPPELIVAHRGLRFTSPALTALDLVPAHEGDGIDQALRARAATLDGMHEALTRMKWRPGNTTKRRFLLDSRDEPWSKAERLTHRILRAAGVSGWCANYAVRGPDRTYFIDVAFPSLRLAIEIDGRLHEDDPDIFENDRWRQNWLVLNGWRVLRFTWKMLIQHPEDVIQAILAALAEAA